MAAEPYVEPEADDWVVWARCYACGHRLAYSATKCPQCGEAFDDRPVPKTWPERCECKRCVEARVAVAAAPTQTKKRAPGRKPRGMTAKRRQ